MKLVPKAQERGGTTEIVGSRSAGAWRHNGNRWFQKGRSVAAKRTSLGEGSTLRGEKEGSSGQTGADKVKLVALGKEEMHAMYVRSMLCMHDQFPQNGRYPAQLGRKNESYKSLGMHHRELHTPNRNSRNGPGKKALIGLSQICV